MSRSLNDLSDRFRPLAFELLARFTEAGIAVMVVDTKRTPEEHAANVARGVSWTKHSKHIDGDAIDVVPFMQYQLHGPDKVQWDPADPTWAAMGRIGEELGLIWGGRWKVRDLGHFEWPS